MPHPFVKIELVIPKKYEWARKQIEELIQKRCDEVEGEINSILGTLHDDDISLDH
jgi:hypothetical protein